MSRIPEEASKRHEILCERIREHDFRYYVSNAPTISDREYDLLFEELKDLEKEHPGLITPASPTQRVGATPVEGFDRFPHPHRMYSLDNTYNPQEVEAFLKRVFETLGKGPQQVDFVVEPKLDGASMELIYEGGQLKRALTRGDGVEGEDVTSNIKTIRSIPMTIPFQGTAVVRGEVFINGEDLERVNRDREGRGEMPFANPRNAAAGSLRLLDPAQAAERPLRIYLYELVEAEGVENVHTRRLVWLKEQGFPVHEMQKECMGIDGVTAAISTLDGMRGDLPFEIDGAVVKVNRGDLREALGFTARFPRWAVAFKFEAEQARTKLLEILVQVGRTGALTPVAVLEPVSLAGTTVSRASLHNEDEIRSKDIRPGDEVLVEKAGEIIPQVVEVFPAPETSRPAPFEMPRTCPSCAAPTSREEGEARWRCTNRLACPGQLKASLKHFSSRGAMDVEHLGPAVIEQLIEAGKVKTPADIYLLTQDDLAGLERMGEKSAANLIEAIQETKKRPLARLITGLGIPMVGEVAAAQLASRYRTLEGMLEADPAKERCDLAEVHGIGEKMAGSVAEVLGDEKFTSVLQALLEVGLNLQAEQDEQVGGALSGMSFCITGKLSAPRGAFQERIRRVGGDIHSAVKKGTDFLVAGEKVGRTKIEKAQAAGARVIDEGELLRMMGGGDG